MKSSCQIWQFDGDTRRTLGFVRQGQYSDVCLRCFLLAARCIALPSLEQCCWFVNRKVII